MWVFYTVILVELDGSGTIRVNDFWRSCQVENTSWETGVGLKINYVIQTNITLRGSLKSTIKDVDLDGNCNLCLFCFVNPNYLLYRAKINKEMCDSGLIIVTVLTIFFVFIAVQSIFYSFDFNCNNFYYDDVVSFIDLIVSL